MDPTTDPTFSAHRAAIAVLAVSHQLLTVDAAARLVAATEADGVGAVTYALAHGALDEQAVWKALGSEFGFPTANLDAADVPVTFDPDLVDGIDHDLLRRRVVLPLRLTTDPSVVVVMVANPTDTTTTDWVARTFKDARIVGAPVGQLAQRITVELTGVAVVDGLEDRPADAAGTDVLPDDVAQTSPIVQWVDQMLQSAEVERASDIHVEMRQNGSLWVRYRIDGDLHERPSGPAGRAREIIGAIQAKAPEIDIADSFVPQDGGFRLQSGRERVDVRLSSIPADAGPKLVMRLLRSSSINVTLADLGHSDPVRAALQTAVRERQGTIIVSGPTGSGKSTTLFALLKEVATPNRNVMTVENPVEYRLPGATQIGVRTNVRDKSRELSFAKALRAILRADPDIIMVGEIRDADTAHTAMEASITGHMVLSTLHTNSALGVFTRLQEQGLPAYMIADAITVAVAQRLTKRLHDCARVRPVTDADRAVLARLDALDITEVAEPVGCNRCLAGYRGRHTVTELVRPGARMRNLLARGRPADEIRDALDDEDGIWLPFTADAARLIRDKVTDPAEVYRALSGAL